VRALPTLLALFPLLAAAESAVRKDVAFSITADVGFGNEVCVLGDHPLLGGGDPLRAPKLAWTPGNVWRGAVALEAATSFTCRYISRSYAVGNWPSTSNQTPLGSPFTMTSPDHPPPPWTTKTVLYRTSWPEPRLLYRDMTRNGAWTDAAMTAVAPGRVPGEQTFGVTGLAPSGALLEFVFHNGGGIYDNSPAPPSGTAQGAAPAVPAPYQGLGGPYNYRTPLDVLLVQDGQVFNYVPPAAISAPRTEVRAIGSTAPGIPGRTVTLLLPRGYDQNTTKHYPVLLFHDGQNVFFPGGPFGTWDADRIAAYETAQGRMREAILVAIPNGNDIGSNRLNEYLPDGDSIVYAGTPYTGRAAAYLQFILDNLMPALDIHYRTIGDAPNTVVAGSSMGGLVTDYLTHESSDRFGAAGIFSPAYWAAPNWVAVARRRCEATPAPLPLHGHRGVEHR
jgi:predicted alpha/beta superfamily hydrolase